MSSHNTNEFTSRYLSLYFTVYRVFKSHVRLDMECVNHVALQGFPNVIRLNGSNSDCETSHFVGACVTIYSLF